MERETLGTCVHVCVCLLKGKRIPVAEAAGATSGKGFKLGRQASESRRTCCWWCRWLYPHDLWPDLCLPSVSLACSSLQPPHTIKQPTKLMAVANAFLQHSTTANHHISSENCWQEKYFKFTEHWQKCPIYIILLASIMDINLCLVYYSFRLIGGTLQRQIHGFRSNLYL